MRDFPLKAHPRSEDGEERDPSSTRLIPVVDDDLVVRQILSRLPVKSLTRFKCVRKGWKSIVEDDSEFINLHYAHSQARPGLLMVPSCMSQYDERPSFFSAELHFADDDSVSDGGRKISGATIHRLGGGRRVESSCPIVRFIGPVRGLLCLFDQIYSVRIYNVSTCQAVTPWIRKPVDRPWCPQRFRFGFDPSTGKYKVVILFDGPAAACEVLTVGVDASWRRIDQVTPCNIRGDIGAYANGSIYWITYTGPLLPRDEIDYPFDNMGNSFGKTVSLFGKIDDPSEEHCEFLVAFDVGSEKFRMITIPSFTFWGYHPFPYLELLEMDGCVTVVRGRRQGAEYNTVKMWKFHDYGKLQGTNGTSLPIDPKQDWSAVTINLPSHRSQRGSFRPIPEEDLMIIGFYDPPSPYGYRMGNVDIPSYCSYNMTSKTFSKFEVQGTSLLGTGFAIHSIFAECLFSGTSNLTYPAPSVRPDPPRNRPVPPQNVPFGFFSWLSSPPTQQGSGCGCQSSMGNHSSTCCRSIAGSSGQVTQEEFDRRLKEKDEEVARLRGIVEGFEARLVALGLQPTGAAAGSSQQRASSVGGRHI